MRIALYAITIVAAALPWIVVLHDLPSVRMWWARRRTRRTTLDMWTCYPEARPASGHPTTSAPNRRGRVTTPAITPSPEVVAGVQGAAL